jgi:hypothetical protein
MKDNYDFSNGKRGAVIKTNKEKITIRLDPVIIQWFRDQVKGGGNYQTLINEALKIHIEQQGESIEEIFRRVIREEIPAIEEVKVA